MQVLDVGGSVIQLRFLPDGQRLLVGTEVENRGVQFDIVSLSGGDSLRLSLPRLDLDSWYFSGYGSSTAVHPSGEWCYIAWGRLFSFWTADGSERPTPTGVLAHQVVISPDGSRLLAAQVTHTQKRLSAILVKKSSDTTAWKKVLPESFRSVAGFLPDSDRFATFDGVVRICSFATGDELSACRYKSSGWQHAQVSPDGRHLGLIGYSSMYVYDLDSLAKPRRIASSSGNFGNFVGFAFHPDGRTLAVIHGGPTLVKLHDVQTLKLTAKFDWKLGRLGCVAFSSDGMLGAAGSLDGRVVLWDVSP